MIQKLPKYPHICIVSENNKFFLYSFLQIDHPEFDIPLESEFKEKNYLEVTYQRLKKGKNSYLMQGSP